MVYTSSHKSFNLENYNTYAISGNRGKDVGYEGKYFKPLAPKFSFWKIWHSNIGKIPEIENIQYYIEEYYKQVLANLDPEDIYNRVNDSVLLCYEDNMEFCHRHIVAAWLEIFLGVQVPEVIYIDNEMRIVERPDYIKKILEDVIKKNKNMRGFNSLRALYLFEKGEELEKQAIKLQREFPNINFEDYSNKAYILQCKAIDEESNYDSKINIKRKK